MVFHCYVNLLFESCGSRFYVHDCCSFISFFVGCAWIDEEKFVQTFSIESLPMSVIIRFLV